MYGVYAIATTSLKGRPPTRATTAYSRDDRLLARRPPTRATTAYSQDDFLLSLRSALAREPRPTAACSHPLSARRALGAFAVPDAALESPRPRRPAHPSRPRRAALVRAGGERARPRPDGRAARRRPVAS